MFVVTVSHVECKAHLSYTLDLYYPCKLNTDNTYVYQTYIQEHSE